MPDASPKTGSRSRLVLLVVVLAIAALGVAFYAARRVIARDALVGWLKARGIASDAAIDRIGLGGLTGRIRIGDVATPDFTAANVEATYGFRGLSLELRSVTLKKPILRASLKGGQLRMGSLDPLIAELRKRPPRPDAAQPRIRIEDGVLLLATDYGPIRASANAVVEDGKLMSLAATSAPAQLKGPAFAASLGPSVLFVTTRGGRSEVRLDAPIAEASAGEAALSGGRLTLNANLPYPDLVKQRGDGKLTLAGRLTATRLTGSGQALNGADVSAGFSGQVTGWITTLAMTGSGTANLRVGSGEVGGGRSGDLRASLATTDLSWTRSGGDRFAATLRATATGEQFAVGGLTLQKLVLAGQGPLSVDAKGLRVAIDASALGRGRWDGLGAPGKDDGAQLIAIKRAARGFRFAAPKVALVYGPTSSVRLNQPLVVRPDGGGELQLAMSGAQAARVTISGGGLPTVDAGLTGVRLTPGGGSASLALKAAMSVGPLQRGEIDTAGRVAVANGALTYAATRCASFRAERLEFGERDVEAVSGRLCPATGPLFSASGANWRFAGRVEDAGAVLPYLQARAAGGAGKAVFTSTGGRFAANVDIAAARVSDTAPETRFNPLAMTGRAELARDVWVADLFFAPPSGPRIATALLRHEVLTGKGGVDIDTGPLVFAEGGLQPDQLSPLLAAVGSPAAGEARFSGGVAWTAGAGFSVGKLTIQRLDFNSPAGRVTGLTGAIALDSLGPLIAAPGQQLRADRLDALVPITDVKATLEIRDEVVHITGGEAAVEGGRVLVESLDLPVTPDGPMKGVLRVEGVQLKNLVEASPFADWMDLDARVSGRVPFETQGGKVRIASGNLEAIAPGRLTIRRELFTGGAAEVKADSEGVAVAPDPNQTFTDMAYQAMEDLAFQEMGATVNSLPNGRLGVLFHIKGRHDPPQKKQIRLSVMDLIRRRFMGKPLPLPSGTEVNLTLDTTLNLDDLLNDYAEFHRTRGSAKVQP